MAEQAASPEPWWPRVWRSQDPTLSQEAAAGSARPAARLSQRTPVSTLTESHVPGAFPLGNRPTFPSSPFLILFLGGSFNKTLIRRQPTADESQAAPRAPRLN